MAKITKRKKFTLQLDIDANPELKAYIDQSPRGMVTQLLTRFLLQNLVTQRLPGLSNSANWTAFKAGLVDLTIAPNLTQFAVTPATQDAGDKSLPREKKEKADKAKLKVSMCSKERNYASSLDEF